VSKSLKRINSLKGQDDRISYKHKHGVFTELLCVKYSFESPTFKEKDNSQLSHVTTFSYDEIKISCKTLT
jgi:hypothetical protein